MHKNLKNFKSGGTATSANAAEMLAKYGNMSEEALFAALMQEVASAKSNGTFDVAALSAQAEAMRPYLSAGQNEKLNHLLGLIRN